MIGIALALPLAGCSTTVQSVTVFPAAGVEVLSSAGQTVQFHASETSQTGSSKPDTHDATHSVTWVSGNTAVATISPSGIATAVGAGTASITAEDGGAIGTSDVTVSGAGSSAPPVAATLVSLTIIPSAITVGNLQDTGQFLAIGTFSAAPFVRDLTNSPTLTWISSAPSVFPVNTNTSGSIGATAGIVTAYGSGSAAIIAEAKDPTDGTIQTATANFNCPLVVPVGTTPGTCYPGSQAPALLATLTVYNEGLNTTNWLLTAPSATGTPNVLDCGPGAPGGNSVCVATYPVGTTVKLTAPATGALFGGWSSNCVQQAAITQAGPNSCQVTLTTNDTVGAIFN